MGSLSSEQRVEIVGATANSIFVCSVQNSGEVNNDDLFDIIIGAFTMII